MYTMADIQRSVHQSSWSQTFLGASTGPGLGTTPHPELRQFANLPMRSDPLEQRQGEPLLSESLLQTLLTSSTLSNSMRPVNANHFHPHYARAPYLDSSQGTDSTMPSGSSLSLTGPTPLGSVQRAVTGKRIRTTWTASRSISARWGRSRDDDGDSILDAREAGNDRAASVRVADCAAANRSGDAVPRRLVRFVRVSPSQL